jgi:hypothetical protein
VERSKRALVVIRRPSDARAAQGLRAAVGYAAVGVTVTVALCGEVDSAAAAHSARHLQALRALAGRVVTVDAQALCALLQDASFGATIVW